jgi:hypothetical protein
MFCQQCGTPISELGKYCGACGKPNPFSPKAPPKKSGLGRIAKIVIAAFGVFFLLQLMVALSGHHVTPSSSALRPVSAPTDVIHEGDTATVKEGLWYCGSSKAALDEMIKWAVRHDRQEVARVMVKTRSVALTKGIQVKVLDSGGLFYSQRKVRTLTKAENGDPAFNPRVGMECWTVMEALGK